MMETNANPDVMGDQTNTAGSLDMKSYPRGTIEEARDRAQERVRSAITETKTSAATTLGGLAQSLLLSSQTLNDQQNGAARYVEQAAERIERASKYLETADINDVMRRTEAWARKNPPLFLGAALALGILGARFFKSGAPAGDQLAGSTAARSGQFRDREVRTPLTEEP
ncbi:MAG: hypothetical protein ACJ79I_05045 [Gemmatimonadaceae bacterium]